jgi:hypothetical protein
VHQLALFTSRQVCEHERKFEESFACGTLKATLVKLSSNDRNNYVTCSK